MDFTADIVVAHLVGASMAVHHPVAAQEEAGKRVGELQSQMYSESHRPLNSGAERPDRVEVGNPKNVADSYSYFGIELISDF